MNTIFFNKIQALNAKWDNKILSPEDIELLDKIGRQYQENRPLQQKIMMDTLSSLVEDKIKHFREDLQDAQSDIYLLDYTEEDQPTNG